MVTVVLFTAIPFSANAQNEIDNADANTQSEASFQNQTALDIIANGLMEGEANESYAVSYLEMSGMMAIVDVGNIAECQLVVAIYDEDTRQMYASGIADVPLEHGKIEVEIDIESLPQYYIVKAFLVDENYAPLCDAYESLMYTRAYEQFLAATPEDYSDEEVIVFDNTKEQADFAVIDSSAITSETSADMSFEYDELTLTFTFYNAIEDVKNLSVGDVYYYEYGDLSNEFLLFKVKSISVSGSTVTIVQDENVSLSEVFSFVRIDAEGDYDNAQIDESTLGEAFIPVAESEPEIITNGIANTPSATESFSTSLNLSYKNPGTGISISGAVAFTMTASVKLSYDPGLFGFDYFEFKSENKFVVKLAGISVTGKFALPEAISTFPAAVIPIGPFTLSLNIRLIAELSASISFDITYEENLIVTADLDSGVKKTTTAESDWDAKLNDKIEIKIGLGLEIKLSLAIVSLSVSGSGGLKYSGNTDTVGVWTNEHHDCLVCTNGKVLLFVDFNIKLSIELGKLDLGWDAIKWSEEWNLFDFYISLNKDGFSCGKGACDRIWYKVNVTVKDNNKKALDGVRVFTDTGVCDANGDGNFNETEMLTNKDGKATFYFKEGSHSVVAKCDGYIMATEVVNIIAKEKTVTIYLKPNTSAEPEKPDDTGSDSDTDDIVTWTFDEETGILIVTGSGKIEDGAFAEWDNILSVVIGNNITSIGDGAFYNCSNLMVVVIGNSVTAIGDSAFCDCVNLVCVTTPEKIVSVDLSSDNWDTLNLKEINTIGKNVKSIDDYAFYYCRTLPSINILGNIKEIGYAAFRDCLELADVTVSGNDVSISTEAFSWSGIERLTMKGVTTIGDYAFLNNCCLEELTISEGVSAIGEGTFLGCGSLTDVYYAGTQAQWNQISIGSDNECLTNATIHYNSKVALASESVSLNNTDILLNSSTVEPESFVLGGCVSGNNYIMLSIADYSNGFILTTDNLYYIDQLVADESGTISTSFIPKSNDKRTTTLLIGDFGNGVQIKILKAGYDYSDCKISIVPYNNLSLEYGDVAYLTAQTNNMPADATIIWSVTGNGVKYSVSDDGTTCKIVATGNGEVTIKAYVVDADGNSLLNINGDAIHSARKLNVDGSFWKIILYIIRSIFGITKTAFQAA